MVAERILLHFQRQHSCSLAKISMVAELLGNLHNSLTCCSLAKISMVAEHPKLSVYSQLCCSLAKISMVAEQKLK